MIALSVRAEGGGPVSPFSSKEPNLECGSETKRGRGFRSESQSWPVVFLVHGSKDHDFVTGIDVWPSSRTSGVVEPQQSDLALAGSYLTPWGAASKLFDIASRNGLGAPMVMS